MASSQRALANQTQSWEHNRKGQNGKFIKFKKGTHNKFNTQNKFKSKYKKEFVSSVEVQIISSKIVQNGTTTRRKNQKPPTIQVMLRRRKKLFLIPIHLVLL